MISAVLHVRLAPEGDMALVRDRNLIERFSIRGLGEKLQ